MAVRPRDYKTEYARRKAGGIARGKTLREARGHAREPEERRERRARTYAVHGVSPERLARARKAFVAHMAQTLGAATTRNRVDRQVLTKHARLLPVDVIEEVILKANAAQLQVLAGKTYDTLILEYPELQNDDKRNPIWYAPDITYV